MLNPASLTGSSSAIATSTEIRAPARSDNVALPSNFAFPEDLIHVEGGASYCLDKQDCIGDGRYPHGRIGALIDIIAKSDLKRTYTSGQLIACVDRHCATLVNTPYMHYLGEVLRLLESLRDMGCIECGLIQTTDQPADTTGSLKIDWTDNIHACKDKLCDPNQNESPQE